MNFKKSLLVSIATHDYVKQVRQLFASAHLAGHWPGDYMVLTPYMAEVDRLWFESRGIEVRTYNEQMSDEEWQKFGCYPYYKKIVIERFHVFREEFKKWDVVVYMDCDIIVTGPILALTQVQGFNATYDLVPSLNTQVWPELPAALSPFDHGYDPLETTFCSGVFAFETKILSTQTYTDLLNLARQFLPAAAYADQLILNLFFYKKWRVLPLAYDYLLTAMPKEALCPPSRALVLHFTAKDVPWADFSPHYHLWCNNLDLSEQMDFKTPQHYSFKTKINERLRAHLFFSPWHLALRFKLRVQKIFRRKRA